MSSLFNQLSHINNRVQSIVKVAEQNGDWDSAYDCVFNDYTSRRVFNLVRDLNFDMEYSDPDTTYEEDTRAFADALNALVTRKRPFYQEG